MKVRERWARPARVLHIEEDPSLVFDEPDGRTFGGLRLTVDAGTAERLRVGRICAKCLEPQETAWPERCSLCGFAMRDEQAEWFRRFFSGVEIVGSRIDLDDELERLKEERL